MQTTVTPFKLMAALTAAVAAMGANAEQIVTPDILVTASRVERELMDVNMAVSVITAKEIAESHAQTIPELLRNIPGVLLQDGGAPGLQHVRIRGQATTSTLILINGQKIAEQKSMSGAIMMIDPSSVERIEVIKGPASVLYGSDAIGGVVNIITKKGGDATVKAEASAGWDSSNNGRSVAAAVGGTLDKFNYRLGLSYLDTDDRDTPEGKLPNTDTTMKNVNGTLSYNFTDDTRVGVLLDHFDLDANGTIIGGDTDAFNFKIHVPEWTRNKIGTFVETKHVNEYLARVRADVFYQKTHKDFLNTIRVSQAMGPRGYMKNDVATGSDNDLDQIGFSLQTDWQLGERNYLVAGYEVNHESLDADTWKRVHVEMKTPRDPKPSITDVATTAHYKGKSRSHALYASLDTHVTDTVVLNSGLRYTYVKNRMTDVNKVTTTPMGEMNMPDGIVGSQHHSRMVGNLGVTWRPTEQWQVHALWSQGFRSPLLSDLYINATMGSVSSVLEPNPNLKPETSDNYEMGIRWMPANAVVDATVFHNRAKNYLSVEHYQKGTDNTGKPVFGDRRINRDKAQTTGLELSASYTFKSLGLTPHLALTAIERKFTVGNTTSTKSDLPPVTATYGLLWEGDVKNTRVHADVYATSYKGHDQLAGDGVERISGWTTFNIKGGVAFGPQKQYSLDVGLYNLGNKLYTLDESLYQPGRHGAVKLNVKF